ncbi:MULTISPECIES: AraC family transcriptional regulator [Azotobacter]|uniref:AraC family transcriptional regulator n=1 Tax=Azotobacter TaxID=352 RepID=UPI000B612AD3|nr:AraC family transcriptional regulator [Azotobacter chroococcum]ASL28935.1 hypothetical protein ACG10_21845 [Azotobacter chroococcum]
MNAIDRLIGLAGLKGTLDLHCRLEGDWSLDHPPLPPGEAAYHIVLRGECRLELPDSSVRHLSAGQILLLPHGMAHELRGGSGRGEVLRDTSGWLPRLRLGRPDEGLDMLCGRFLHAPGATLFAALPEQVLVQFPAPGDGDPLGALVGLLRGEAEEERPGTGAVIDALSSALFTLILRAYLAQQQDLSGVVALLLDRRLGRAASALLEDLARNWTVDELARQARMSRSTFMRRFALLVSMSPLALLTRLRLERARALLLGSSLGAGAIALEVGYQSQGSFTRAFRQAFGVAPGQFRQAARTVR